MYYAKRQGSGVMRKVLEELLREEEARKVSIHPFFCGKNCLFSRPPFNNAGKIKEA